MSYLLKRISITIKGNSLYFHILWAERCLHLESQKDVIYNTIIPLSKKKWNAHPDMDIF